MTLQLLHKVQASWADDITTLFFSARSIIAAFVALKLILEYPTFLNLLW